MSELKLRPPKLPSKNAVAEERVDARGGFGGAKRRDARRYTERRERSLHSR